MASRKLTKQIYKLLKKAVAAGTRKDCIAYGVKACARDLRRDKTGFLIIAGDMGPIDLISHLPVFAEEKDVPYCFIPCKEDLAAAVNTHDTLCVFVKENESITKLYATVLEEIKNVPAPVS